MKQTKEIEAPLSLAQLLSLHDAVYPVFQKKWTSAEENEGKLKADNWTNEQKKEIKRQDRIPLSMPINATYIQRISATQKQSRQSWKVEASVDPDDEIKAELTTLVLRDYERQNKMKYIESEVFDDGIGVKMGVDKFVVDYSEVTPKIGNVKVDNRNIVWDVNDTSYELNKVLFVSEIERVYAYELPYDVFSSSGSGSLQGRDKINYYVVGKDTDDQDYRVVSVFHHYQRVKKNEYYVLFKDTQGVFNFNDVIIQKYRDKKKAEKLLDDIRLIYEMNGLDFEGEGEVVKKDVYKYDYYKFTFNKILEYEETDLEVHPYNFYFAIKVANDWISLMDFMSSPQLFMDRLWMQVDYSFRKELKQLYELNVNALDESKESAIKKANQTGGVVTKKGYEKVFEQVLTQGFNPQYIQIVGIMQSYMSEITGGANFQGNKETSNESGRAVALRQQQGKLVAFLFLDNLERYKVNKGEKLLKYIEKYDSASRIIKVTGNELTPEMMQLLQESGSFMPSKIDKNSGFVKIGGMDFLKNAKFELNVSAAPMSNVERAYKLSQYIDAEKSDPILSQLPTWRLKKLELLDIPQVDRYQIIKEYEQTLQGNATPNKVTESINFKDLPPDGKVQMARHAGIEISPPQTMEMNNEEIFKN